MEKQADYNYVKSINLNISDMNYNYPYTSVVTKKLRSK